MTTAPSTPGARAAARVLARREPGAIALLRFELFVRDPRRSTRFYEEALGFAVGSTGGDPASEYVELTNGAVRIGIGPITTVAENHHFSAGARGRLGVGVEIVFEVDDILEYERRARRADALFEPLKQRPWGRRDFRVVDPDGYYIRVTETLREGTRAGAATRHGADGGSHLP